VVAAARQKHNTTADIRLSPLLSADVEGLYPRGRFSIAVVTNEPAFSGSPHRHIPDENAGINASVVRILFGHESQAVSANYTHIDEETKRKAIALLPAIPGIDTGRKTR
jgi:hypothetical protein